MRRSLIAISFVALALLTAACTATAGPGWTYAPPTPSPTAGPSTEASAGASAAPSTEASAGASAGAPTEVPGGGGGIVPVSALNIAFEQTEISAPANTAFTIHFSNKDAGVPHNVAIHDANNMEMFKGDIVTGPAEVDYHVPALPAGSYTFSCTVHPNMTGKLTVGG